MRLRLLRPVVKEISPCYWEEEMGEKQILPCRPGAGGAA